MKSDWIVKKKWCKKVSEDDQYTVSLSTDDLRPFEEITREIITEIQMLGEQNQYINLSWVTDGYFLTVFMMFQRESERGANEKQGQWESDVFRIYTASSTW